MGVIREVTAMKMANYVGGTLIDKLSRNGEFIKEENFWALFSWLVRVEQYAKKQCAY